MYHVSLEIEGLLRRGVSAGIKAKTRAHALSHFYVTFSWNENYRSSFMQRFFENI